MYAIIGPLLGATMVLLVGFNYVLIFDAMTFLISFIVLRSLYKSFKNVEYEEELDEQEEKRNVSSLLKDLNGFPSWTYWGLNSWFFIAVAIGLMGAAGPTLVISNHSATEWALVATTMATGSLVGSALSLSGQTRIVPWPKIHVVCGIGIGLQLVVLSLPVAVWVLCLSVFVGAACVTVSGIRCGTCQPHMDTLFSS